jgi:4-nitrophenyl phosphatase
VTIDSTENAKLKAIRCFLLDVDGVLYRGDTPIPGAPEFIAHLQNRSIPYALITNNAMATPEQYEEKFARMGMNIPASAIFTSGKATAQYLLKLRPAGASVFAIGMAGLLEPLGAAGFWSDEVNPEYVCVGLDRSLSYEKLARACRAIRAGAVFVGTNPDRTLPTEEGLVPGNGSILAALVACTDVQPIIIGKPEPTMLYLAMETLGVSPEETAVIGDRLDTDILAGQRASITTILVLTGVSTEDEARGAEIPPDVIVPDLDRLRSLVVV